MSTFDELRTLLCTTLHDFAKKEPTQFQDADWQNDEFTYWRFDRVSMQIADKLLDQYEMKKSK